LSKEGYVVLLPHAFGSRGHGDLCAVPTASRPVQADRELPRDAYWDQPIDSRLPDSAIAPGICKIIPAHVYQLLKSGDISEVIIIRVLGFVFNDKMFYELR
jgi:hypothetical protein